MERPVLKFLPRIGAQAWLGLGLLSACAVAPPARDTAAVVETGAVARTGQATSANPAPRPRAGSLVAPPGEGSPDSIFDLLPAIEEAPVHTDLWRRIAAGLQLQSHYDRPEVREQVRLYASRPDYFEQVGERARPFLYNIVQKIEQRGLPMEIALMPFVESGFNPNAVSPRAAVGPWQFIAGTGRSLGLRVDAWFDGRRDPIQATTAALDYLEIQQQRFAGNWLLALAAYNSGPANVKRSLRATSASAAEVDFWQLPLPAETRIHVPRILALASILTTSKATGHAFPDIANEEPLARVEVGPNASVALAAELAGIEPELLRALNPGLRQWWTPPDGNPDYLHVPAGNAESLRLALLEDPNVIRIHARRYLVQPGDTLWAIARRNGLDVATLARINGIDPDDFIQPGQQILLSGDAGAVGEKVTAYRVRRGDTLSRIASRNGVALTDILRWNAIAANELIFPGQVIRLAPPSERQ